MENAEFGCDQHILTAVFQSSSEVPLIVRTVGRCGIKHHIACFFCILQKFNHFVFCTLHAIGMGLPHATVSDRHEFFFNSSDFNRSDHLLSLSYFFPSSILITLAGLPPTIAFAGTSFVTTAPPATTAFSPIVTPGIIEAPAPIHAFLPILTVRHFRM